MTSKGFSCIKCDVVGSDPLLCPYCKFFYNTDLIVNNINEQDKQLPGNSIKRKKTLKKKIDSN